MVEWKIISEVCECIRGVRVIKKDLTESGLYPVYQNSLKPMGYYSKSNFEANTPFVITAGAAGDVGSSKQSFWAADDCLCLKCSNTVSNKYVLFFLETKQHYFKSQVRKGAIPRLSRKVIENLQIPIPPLSEQNRIVGILDTFTASIDNLKAQITQRRKQYEHLIDKCFGGTYDAMMDKVNKGKIIVEPLSAHGIFTRGKRFVRTDIVKEGQSCIHYGDMYTTYGLSATETVTHLPYDFPKKMRYVKPGDLVIVGAGENNEDIGVGLAWFGNEPAAVHDACYIYEGDFNPMYLSYFLRSGIYHLQIKSNVVRGKICSISSNGIGRALIPIVSKEQQKEMVDSLLPFEDLLKNLNEQLSLRQKQYEFYRNQLLTFIL